MDRYKYKLEQNEHGWHVVGSDGRRYLERGESYQVASNVCDALNGFGLPHGHPAWNECDEVAESIKAREDS